MIPRYLIVGAFLAGAVALWGHGYRTGGAVAEGRHAAALAAAQRATFAAAEEASRRELARLEAEAALMALSRELEDAARADPPASACVLPASRVLRLNRR